MKNLLILTAGLLMFAGNAFASGSHSDGHGHDEAKKEMHSHGDAMAVGNPGKVKDVVYTKGVVKKINMKSHKVTIIHEELENLDMPAMTMVFRTVDDAMLEKMKVGAEIEFVADRVKGKLTVIELK